MYFVACIVVISKIVGIGQGLEKELLRNLLVEMLAPF